MKRIKNLIKDINIYGIEFPLLYQKEKNYTTIIDILLSLASITLMLIISIKYFSEYLSHSNFNIVTNYHPLNNTYTINLSSNPIIYGLYNWNGTIKKLDPTYVYLTLDQNNHYINDKHLIERESKNIKLEFCNETEENNKIFESLNLGYSSNYYICVKSGQNLTISGRFNDIFNGFNILETHLNRCINSTNSSIVCRSNEEINDYIKNSYLHIFYTNNIVNHYNYSYPISEIFRTDCFPISLNQVKRYYYYFTYSVYMNIKGFIFENTKITLFHEFNDIYVDNVENEENSYYENNIIFEILFTVWDKEIKYIRTFPKIQDVLSNIGGLSGIIITIFQYISCYFSEKFFLAEISNNLINNSKIKKSYYFKKEIMKNSLTMKNELSHISSTKFIEGKSNLPLKKSNSLNIQSRKNMSDPSKKSTILLKNNFIDEKNINKKEKSDFNYFSDNSTNSLFEEKHKIKFPFYYYLAPFWSIDFSKKNDIFYCYDNILKKFLSIEVLIPILERISLMTDMKKNDKFIFKIDTFLNNNVTKN